MREVNKRMKDFHEHIITVMLMDLVDSELLTMEEAELAKENYLQNSNIPLAINQDEEEAA